MMRAILLGALALLAAAEVHAQPACSGMAIGDRVAPSELAGRTVSRAALAVPRWRETAHARVGALTAVALEEPGDAAALVVFSHEASDPCVRAVWGISFGGHGVVLTIADTYAYAADAALIAIETVAQYNDPAGSDLDPYEHRRVLLHVSGGRADVLADTQDARFAALARHDWLIRRDGQHLEVVAVGRRAMRRFRFDPAATRLVPR